MNISKAEEARLRQYADSIVVKTAHSYQRVLDEVSLFLHVVGEARDKENGQGYSKLGALEEVLKSKTVLIADDDVRNIFSLTKALEQHKMKVFTAMDGKEALSIAEDNPVDIVLMDMMMPEMDGYEAITRIRRKSPAASPAHPRRHRQGHDRRPGEMYPGRSFRLYFQTCGYRSAVVIVADMAVRKIADGE